MLADTPRRKLIKTNQQKENGRTSPSTNSNSTETEMRSTSPSLLQPVPSTNIEEDNQESISSMIDDDDLNRKVEQCFRDNSEQKLEDHFMDVDQPLEGKEKIFSSIN